MGKSKRDSSNVEAPSRRDVLKVGVLGMSALGLAPTSTLAGAFSLSKGGHLIPADKKLSRKWLRSLYERGSPDVYSKDGNGLRYVAMPVGGVACGHLYISGDGRLWLWHIFRTRYTRNPDSQPLIRMEQGGHYAYPERMFLREDRPVAQGVAIKVVHAGKETTRGLNADDVQDVRFRGEYPVSRITYRSDDLPVEVRLEAFSPFIPGELDRSANPATILAYAIKNTSSTRARASLAGWLEHAVCPYASKEQAGTRAAELVESEERKTLFYQVEGDETLPELEGYGSLGWSLYEPGRETRVAFDVPAEDGAEAVFAALEAGNAAGAHRGGFDRTQVHALAETVELEPGEEKEVVFVLTWYFPHLNNIPEGQPRDLLKMKDLRRVKLHYADRFGSADEVAAHVCGHFEELAGGTRLWSRTYYDSTLPYWLLDRSFIPLNAMATNTLLRFDNGRLWGWEGVECCPGTCTHVWQYAQGMARIFPEAERTLREGTDLDSDIGFVEESGGFAYRAESHRQVAHDGHCGTIMRMYREHTLSRDDTFLKINYPKIKRSVQFIIGEDADRDGILEGKQVNTLDAAWYGPMGWLSSLYLGALAAGKQMALDMGDHAFAEECHSLLEKGRKNLVKELFNGEYFIHKPDYENHPDAINSNDGCHIDQVLGQSFASQYGVPERVVPERETKRALESIWTYSFAPDAFAYQEAHKAIKGPRIYATAGEAGTLMCTWPRGGAEKAVPGMEERMEHPTTWSGPGIYFDEVMNGFEYQVAVHMVWEGLLEKGLATARAVHDRYSGAGKRNPFNEIECSDHYSRSMASYGLLLAVCGFDYHGPKGHIAFDPKISPENFRAPFTVAEGWGTFAQTIEGKKLRARIDLRYGTLKLQTLSLRLPEGGRAKILKSSLGPVHLEQDGRGVTVHLDEPVRLNAGAVWDLELDATARASMARAEGDARGRTWCPTVTDFRTVQKRK